MRLGIDFGTTHTVVAMSDRGSYPTVSFVDSQNDVHEYFPSVVAFEQGQPQFGFDAIELAGRSAIPLRRSFKRWLGGVNAAPAQPVPGVPTMNLLDLVTGFASALKGALLKRSTMSKQLKKGEKLEIALAVPANAHSAQRFITLEGFRRAGFEVCMMMNEPSAAGVEYAHHHLSSITSRRDLVLVYDLGGGTFDVSLVSMQAGKHEVMQSGGISRLGGDDFDETLLELALRELHITRGDLSARARSCLLAHCCEVKEGIKPNTRRLLVDVGSCLDVTEMKQAQLGPEGVVLVPADDFEEAAARIVSRSLGEVERVIAGHEAELAGVYVVGGGSTLPVVGRALRERFARRVHRSAHPSSATAMGLAIALDPSSGVGVRELLNRCFGVFREANDGGGVSFDVILDSALQVPGDFGARHAIRRRYQPAHNVGHFRFIECSSLSPDRTPSGDITHFAQVVFPFDPALQREDVDISAVPVVRSSASERWIEEQYEVDSAGIVTLLMLDVQTGYQQVHRFG